MGDAKPMTKSQIVATIAEDCDLTKKQAAAALESLADCIRESLAPGGPGSFAIPGLVKIEKKEVPARSAKFGVPNPFRPGETMNVPYKPATTKVKVRALKNLRGMV